MNRTKLFAWGEKNRDRILAAHSVLSWGAAQVVWLGIRTLVSAAVLLGGFLFFLVTPDTTVYELSQIFRSGAFWRIAFVVALSYTALLWASRGPRFPKLTLAR